MTVDSAGIGVSAGASPATPATPNRIWHFAWPVALFLVITIFVAADVAADVRSGISSTHVLLEVAALGVAFAGVTGTGLQLVRATRRAHDLQRDLLHAREDLHHWRSEAQALLARLGTALENQFRRWDLTEAESDIALLILKGLAYKDIANVRGTTERTVRHQAIAIFRKAGFAGRAEMAAFFLQDLLLPSRGASPDDRRADDPDEKTKT